MASLSNMLILVIGLLGLYGTVRSDPDISVTLILCNGGGYTKGDPFATSLTYVVEDLEAKTPKRKGYNYYNISPYPNSFAYGYASCSQNLTSKDCSTCLSSAKTAMFGTCDNRIGARAVLHDCQIRYEQYPFDDQTVMVSRKKIMFLGFGCVICHQNLSILICFIVYYLHLLSLSLILKSWSLLQRFGALQQKHKQKNSHNNPTNKTETYQLENFRVKMINFPI